MEEISEDASSEASATIPSNGKGSSRNRDKKLARKNSDLSCKSKRKVKRFSFGKWQKGLNKDKNKKQVFNLNRESCCSSSSIVSESSLESVTCICTGYRRTKAIAEKGIHREKTVAHLIEDLASTDDQNQAESTPTVRHDDNHRNPVSQGATTSNISTQRLEMLQPSLPNINEISFAELTLVLRNHPRLPEISEQLAAHYGNLRLAYEPSSFHHFTLLNSVHTQIDYIHHLVPRLSEITNCSYYWGQMDRYKAEKELDNKPEGTFLLRDSAQEEYLFSVSFRRYSRTLHARIEQLNHKFSFDSHDPNVFSATTVCSLVERYKNPRCCMYFEPMLTIPVHRTFPFSLQHLCRSTIADCITYNDINQLKLPKKIKSYLKEYHYKQKICVRHLENDV